MHWVSKVVKAAVGASERRYIHITRAEHCKKIELHRDVMVFWRFMRGFQKDDVVTIGEGEILSLFEEIPFRPPQGSHVTHVWEGIGAQIIFSRTLWRSKAVFERRVVNGVGDEHTSCLQVQWTDFMGSR